MAPMTSSGAAESSGKGQPRFHVHGARSLRVGIVAGSWHAELVEALLAGAKRSLGECRVEDHTVVRVPGAFDLPVAAKRLADLGYDAVIALAVVIRGETPHFDYICQGATVGLTQVSVDTGVPVGFGLLTCENEQQAWDRAGGPGAREDKGAEAALSAVATAVALRELKHGYETPGRDSDE